nr:MAG TPA: hypothetical protein [Caudoviricetes sp.]
MKFICKCKRQLLSANMNYHLSFDYNFNLSHILFIILNC